MKNQNEESIYKDKNEQTIKDNKHFFYIRTTKISIIWYTLKLCTDNHKLMCQNVID